MNIALTGVLAFFFLLPGLIFRRFYYTEEFSKEYFYTNYLEVFLSAFLPSLGFYFLWFCFASLFGFGIDWIALGYLLVGKQDDALHAFRNIKDNILWISIFHLTLYPSSGLLAYLSKKLIRHYKLDRTRKIFRFQNSWHYIITGEFFDFRRTNFNLQRDQVEDIEFVYVKAMLDSQQGTFLDQGTLVDYELSKTGQLEHITLKDAERKYMGASVTSSVGQIIIIPFSDIIDLDLTYYKLVVNAKGQYGVKRVR